MTVIPWERPEWYAPTMSGPLVAVMGDRGRLVVPADLRARQGWQQGDVLVFVEQEGGVLLATREQILDALATQLDGPSLADELIAERRQAAVQEERE